LLVMQTSKSCGPGMSRLEMIDSIRLGMTSERTPSEYSRLGNEQTLTRKPAVHGSVERPDGLLWLEKQAMAWLCSMCRLFDKKTLEHVTWSSAGKLVHGLSGDVSAELDGDVMDCCRERCVR
jgi:hypothetical protein